MYKKDYIIRMVEMIGEFIATIMGYIKKGELGKATQSLENLYYDFLKKDAAFFAAIPKEELTHKLIGEHNFTNEHLHVLAELFFTEAELRYAKGDKTLSIAFYEKSLHLFEFLDKETKTYSIEQQNRIQTIQNRLGELGLV
jgi:hypothetical protein